MTLVDMLEPRVLVELGTQWGASYCGFCEAVADLRLPTKCFAIDTWLGDEHASFYDDSVFDDFALHHDQRYSSFSTILRTTSDCAVTQFDDATTDLLHIDGYHTYDAVKHNFETWRPKRLKTDNAELYRFHDAIIANKRRECAALTGNVNRIRTEYSQLRF